MPLVALLVTAVVAVSCLYPRVLGNRSGLALMLPVLGYTLVHYIDWRLPSLGSLIGFGVGGAALGALLFVLGLPISSDEPRRVLSDSIRGLRGLAGYPDLVPRLSLQAVIITYEELIWRVFLTQALLPVLPLWAVVGLTALLFWLVHAEIWPIGGHSLELLLFALALGALYVSSGSLVLVWLAHAVRNLLILTSWWHAATRAEPAAR